MENVPATTSYHLSPKPDEDASSPLLSFDPKEYADKAQWRTFAHKIFIGNLIGVHLLGAGVVFGLLVHWGQAATGVVIVLYTLAAIVLLGFDYYAAHKCTYKLMLISAIIEAAHLLLLLALCLGVWLSLFESLMGSCSYFSNCDGVLLTIIAFVTLALLMKTIHIVILGLAFYVVYRSSEYEIIEGDDDGEAQKQNQEQDEELSPLPTTTKYGAITNQGNMPDGTDNPYLRSFLEDMATKEKEKEAKKTQRKEIKKVKQKEKRVKKEQKERDKREKKRRQDREKREANWKIERN